jgi:hypothetical protein
MRREVLPIIFAYLLWAAVMAISLLRAQGTTALSQEEKPTLIPQGGRAVS